jgi:hypothetical protein
MWLQISYFIVSQVQHIPPKEGMTMLTAFVSPELKRFLEIMEECDMTPARLGKLVCSGIVHDMCDVAARFDDRVSVCKALKLDLQHLGIYHFSVEYGRPVAERIEACKKDFPWRVELKEDAFEGNWQGTHNHDLEGKLETEHFEARLLEMPESISREDVLRRIKRKDGGIWVPADTDHMLAFATKYPKIFHKGKFRYVVGLGTTPSVLLAIFQGLGSGMSYHVAPLARKWEKCHDGGEKNRYLVVRRLGS